MRIRTYRELIRLPTFEERFEYLCLKGRVGESTFGFDRWINQDFYHSKEWRLFRRGIIVRDSSCDLAFPDREIFGRVIIHHLNPVTVEDLELGRTKVFDPDNVVCVSHMTSNAIHYGNANLLASLPKERREGDTDLWTRVSSTR